MLRDKLLGNTEKYNFSSDLDEQEELCTVDYIKNDEILKLWFFLKTFRLLLIMILISYFFGIFFKLVIVLE